MARQSEVYVSAGWKANWGVDQHDLTGQGNDLEHDRSTKEIEGKGFGKRAMVKLPGLQDGDITIKGEYASGEKLHGVFTRRYGRSDPSLLWYALEGTAAGADVVMQPSRLTSYKLSTKTDDPVQHDSKWSANGDIDDGHILVSPDALVTGATFTGPAVDSTAIFPDGTNSGGAAQLHVWAINGGTAPTVAGTVQGSVDAGTTWTTVIAVPALNKKGARRVELGSADLVPELIRGKVDMTGTPTSVQVLFMAARGIDPDDPNVV